MYYIMAPRRLVTPGMAQLFNGSGGFLGIPDNASLSMSNVSFTIIGWCKPDVVGTSQVVLGKAKAATIAGVEYDLQINAAGFTFVVVSDGSNVYLVTGNSLGTITAGVWNMIGLGVQVSGNPLVAGTIFTYKNGSSQTGSLPAGVNLQDGTGLFSLGGVSGAMTLSGAIDAVGIWRDRTLSDAESNTLYASGAGFRYSTLPASLKTNLVSWYELDEATGSLVYVDVLGANNLSRTGTVTQVPGKT
jgi:hypothetical protein